MQWIQPVSTFVYDEFNFHFQMIDIFIKETGFR